MTRQQNPFQKRLNLPAQCRFEQIRERITPQDEERLDEAIDRAVREVRAEKTKAYERPTT